MVKRGFHNAILRLAALAVIMLLGTAAISSVDVGLDPGVAWAGPATEKDDPGSPWADPDNPVIQDGRVYDGDFYKTLVPALVFVMMGAVAFMFAVTFVRSRRRRRTRERQDVGTTVRGEDGEW